MSNLVEQIHDEIETITAATLPAGYQKMKRIFDPSQNNLRLAENSYGVFIGESLQAESVLKFYTMDQTFEVLLLNTFANRLDDAVIKTTVLALFDQVSELFKAMIATKINLPTIVLGVFEQAIAEPEVLENQGVLLRTSFVVKYREQF